MKKKLWWLAIAGVLIGGVIYYFTQHNQTGTTFLTEEVKRSDVEKTVVASGSIESSNEVDVGAQVSGKITKLYVTLGQEVKKGDMIADIDSTTQVNNLNTKKAALASLQAQLKGRQTAYDVALSSYNRLAKLYKQQATSLDSLNTAKSALDTTKAEMEALRESIKQAEIEVNTAETNVSYTKITSPIDGTVISTPISEGQTVNSNQSTPTIVTVANLDRMLIKAEISEGDITKVKAGQEVNFKILSDNLTVYQAVIDSVDPATTTKTDAKSSSSLNSTTSSSSTAAVYYYANMAVNNPNRVLRIGMTTENTIKIASVKNVLTVPNMSLQKEGNRYFVRVLKGTQAERREVQIGEQNDFQTEIKSGLTEGDKVILSQLTEGEQVGSMRGPRVF